MKIFSIIGKEEAKKRRAWIEEKNSSYLDLKVKIDQEKILKQEKLTNLEQ
jgi:hypothetical protein